MTSTTTTTTRQPLHTRWRTVDIVVGAVLAVAFGLVFQAWNLLWSAMDPVFEGFRPAGGIMAGIWLLAGVTGALVLRKPGAALFVELVASIVSALIGAQWGLLTVVYGGVQGLAVELVFLVFLYRRWTLPVAVLAGGAAGVGAAVLDLVNYYPEWSTGWQATYLLLVTLSGLVLAGGLGWALVRSLARTGVLSPFASGREQQST
jgi:energy-coupling factor transport system substrate-specific component